MNLHFMTPGDTVCAREIWEACFDEPKAFTDIYFSKRYDHKNAISVIEGGEIMSMLQIIPYNMNVRGKRIKCGFIIGVSTRPEFRGQGYMRFLMESAFHVMESRGEYISCLYPERSYGLYRAFGYEIVTSSCRYSLQNRHIPLYSGDYVLEPLNLTRHKASVKKCYDTYMQAFSGYIERSLRDWQFKLSEWKACGYQGVACFHDNSLVGYAVFEPENTKTVIHETAFTDAGALECIMNALSMSGTRLDISLSEHHQLFERMNDGRGIVTLDPFLMGKILNVKGFMRKLPIKDAAPVTLEITDNHEGNSGVFTLSASGLRSSFDTPELIMSIQCFTQIAFGYVSATQALYNGMLKGSADAATRLNQLLPKVDTFCLDQY